MSIKEDGNIRTTEYETTQLISKKQDNTGNIIEEYADITVVELDEIVPMSTGSGSKSRTNSDSSASCSMKLTIYYTYSTANKRDLVKLTKVTGSVSKPSPTRVTIYKANMTVGQTGWTADPYVTQTKDYNLMNIGISSTGGSFSVIPPSTWKPVVETSIMVGANYTVYFKIGTTSSWYSSVQCMHT